MPYVAPSQRIAMYKGIRLGTELITITPGMSRLGGEDGTDIDQDTVYINPISPNMKFIWNVVTYLQGEAVAGATRQIELHRAFIQEMRNFLQMGLRLNDLVWIDDVSLTTLINMPGPDTVGPQTNFDVTVDDVTVLSISPGDYVWIGDETAGEGFFAKAVLVGAGPPHTIRLDSVPGQVLDGGVEIEEARRIGDNYTVYKASMCYRRCKYNGQSLPEVQEGGQDTHRFNQTYEFHSDTPCVFTGAT